MGLAHVGNEAVVRTGYYHQLFYVAGMRSTHLDDRDFGFGGHLEQAQGHSYIVVQIALGGGYAVLGAEHSRHEFLGGGLAVGAGKADYRYSKPFAVKDSEFLELSERIPHLYEFFRRDTGGHREAVRILVHHGV